MTIEHLSVTARDTQDKALENTVLSPRFYTTDFDELDRMDVEPVRAEWNLLIAEMESDPNKFHFKRGDEWDPMSLDDLPKSCARSSWTSW